MNEEIAELADDIYWKGSRFNLLTKSGCEDLAEELYNDGYGKVEDYKKEIENLKKKIEHMANSISGLLKVAGIGEEE